MLRAVENSIVPESLPRTVAVLADWQPTGALPPEAAFAAMADDLRNFPPERNLAVLARQLNATREGLPQPDAENRQQAAGRAARQLAADPDRDRQEMGAMPAYWCDAEERIRPASRPPTCWRPWICASTIRGDVASVAPERALYLSLLWRTFEISLEVALLCALFGFPGRLRAQHAAAAPGQPADDLRHAAVLDLAAGAHHRLDHPAAGQRAGEQPAAMAERHRRSRWS